MHAKSARGNLRLPVFQKTQGILKLKEENGHIISTYPLKSCLTWTKSLFDCEKDLRSRTYGLNGRHQCERRYLVNVCEYHSSSSSSSWSGQ